MSTGVVGFRKWLRLDEMAALIEVGVGIDPDRLGWIPVAAIGEVLAAVGSEVNTYMLCTRHWKECV